MQIHCKKKNSQTEKLRKQVVIADNLCLSVSCFKMVIMMRIRVAIIIIVIGIIVIK